MKKTRELAAIAFGILAIGTRAPLSGQDAAPRDSIASPASDSAQAQAVRTPLDFGVDTVNILQIPAAAFTPVSSKITYDYDALNIYR